MEWIVIACIGVPISYSLTSHFFRRVKLALTSPYTEDDEDAPRYARRSEPPE